MKFRYIKLWKMGYTPITFAKLKTPTKNRFIIKWAGNAIVFLLRVDINNKAYIVVIRKAKGFIDHLHDLAYGYL